VVCKRKLKKDSIFSLLFYASNASHLFLFLNFCNRCWRRGWWSKYFFCWL